MGKIYVKGAILGGLFGLLLVFIIIFWNPSFVTVFSFIPSLIALLLLALLRFIFQVSIVSLTVPFIYIFIILFYLFVGVGIEALVRKKKSKK